MSEDIIVFLLVLIFYILLILTQYWIGRIAFAIYERDWVRTEDRIVYWGIGMILMNITVWSIVGIMKLLN